MTAIAPNCGGLEGGRHFLRLRIYHEDTDFSGLVYHASYLRFFERGRTELLRAIGFEHGALLQSADAPLIFVVRRMTISFRRPALMDDAILVETAIAEIRPASIEFMQRIFRAEHLLVECRASIASVHEGRPRRLPDHIRRAFARTTTVGAPEG